jgi:pimeloyl-ACP methyl ester carboxylesterase
VPDAPRRTLPDGMRRTMTDVDLGGDRKVGLHALVAGPDVPAPDVVVVPGLGVSAYLRPSVAATGARGVRCWLVDPPGFGDSGDDPARRPPTIPRLAAAIVAWLDRRVDPERLVLVGHSSGTQVAARAAAELARRPGRAPARLVLASPTVDPAHRPLPRLLGRWLADGRREPRSLVRTQIPEWRRAGPRRLTGLLRAMLTEDLEQDLEQVRCPVTVVRGGNDPISTTGWAARLAQRPNRELVELLGLPHAFPYGDPDAFATILTAAGREVQTTGVITALPAGHPVRTGLHGWSAR